MGAFDDIEDAELSEDPRQQIRDLAAFAVPAAPVASTEHVASARTVQGPPPRRTVVQATVPARDRSSLDAVDELAILDRAKRAEIFASPSPTPEVSTPLADPPRASLATALPEREALIPRETPARSDRYGGRPSRETTFGRKVGKQRAIGLYLPRTVREALEQRRTSNRETRGAILVEAFRSGYRALLTEYEQVFDDDPMFGTPVRSGRSVEDGAMVTFYVPEPQTESIVTVADRLGVSVSEAGTMALSLLLLGPESLNA
jgi:hypothetical protein